MRERPKRREGAPATVGLLIDRLEDDYQSAVLAGVLDATREKGSNLFCFTGGVVRAARRPGAERNAVYDIVSPESVDGLLIMAGALGNTVGMAELSRICERYRPLPICSIAIAIDNHPCVLIDNMSGMWSLVLHLVKDHGLRKIAFIRGPEANSEAERRYRVYRDVLTQSDIPLNPSLVVSGDFQRSAGVNAVRALLDERRVEIDAIVAANDGMALGAIEALHAHGKRVPEDIVVVGFDDVEEARLFTPPLTTVRQPLQEQGRRATQILLDRIDGRFGGERVVLKTEVVTRRSCGCLARPLELLGGPPSSEVSADPTSCRRPIDVAVAAVIATRDDVIARMTKAARADFGGGTDWAARLFDAFAADLEQTATSTFLSVFDAILRAETISGGDSAAWQDVLSAMRRGITPALIPGEAASLRAEDLWHEARIWQSGAEARAQARRRLFTQRGAKILGQIGAALITSFDLEALTQTVTVEFPRIGIPSAYISLYEGDRAPSDASRLILAYDTTAEIQPKTVDPIFPSKRLAPDGILPIGRRMELIVMPLFFKEDQLGFVLFELGPRQGDIYEILRDLLSAALKGSLLVKTVAEKDREQQRLLVDMEKRSVQMEKMQDALKESQAKLGTARSAAKEAMRLASSAAERAQSLGRTGYDGSPGSREGSEPPESDPQWRKGR